MDRLNSVLPGFVLLVLGCACPMTLWAAVPITEWGTVITVSEETYQLVGDLQDDQVEPWAITIAPGVHDVAIEGGGFSLVGDGASSSFEGGIHIVGVGEGIVGVRIEGVRLRNLDSGISAEGSICRLIVRGCELQGLTDGRAISVRTLDPDDVARWITVRDSRIRDGSCLGIVLENAGNVQGSGAEMSSCTIASNSISNLTAPVTTPENDRGGIVCLHGGERIRIRDNVVLGGFDMSAVFFSSDDEPGEEFDRITITGNLLGDRSGSDGSATAVSGIKCDRIVTTNDLRWNLRGNYLFSNEGDGVDVVQGAIPVTLDARRCWWGDDSGPDGAWGDGASTGLFTDPVVDLPDGLLLVPNLRLTGCAGWQALVGLYNQDQDWPGLRGFDVDLSIISGEADLLGYEPGGYFDQTGLGSQYYLSGEGDLRTLTGTILGGVAPLAVGNGDLFRLIFHGLTDNTPTGYDGELSDLLLRDPDNIPVEVDGLGDARMTVDCTPPDLSLSGASNACGIPTISIVAIDHDLDQVFVRIVPACWRLVTSEECQGLFETDLLMPEFADLPDGNYEIEVCATDDAGNSSQAIWSFVKDTTPPPSVEDLMVTPMHNRIELTWAPSALPVEIVRKEWSHPEYDDDETFPGFSVDPSDGLLMATLAPGSGSYADDFDDASRNVYFYTLFHRDDCDRFSDPDSGSTGTATSYWLGDFTTDGTFGPPYDGYVTALDLALISGGYGQSDGETGYDPQLDIGPTSTGWVDGYPLTDNIINDQDISIFAAQYGNVGPALPDAPLELADGTPGIPRLSLEVAPGNETDLITLTLRLDGNRAEVQTIHAQIGLDPDAVRCIDVTLVEPLADLPDPVFLGTMTGDPALVDLVVSALGRGRAFAGSGPIAAITLRKMGQLADRAVSLQLVDLRDTRNRRIESTLPAGEWSPPAEATVSRPQLLTPVPNPLRGISTRLRFLLDRPGRCEVAIYDAGGRLVRRLLEGNCSAGFQGLDWDGRCQDGRMAPSGIYHCVLMTERGIESRRIAVLR